MSATTVVNAPAPTLPPMAPDRAIELYVRLRDKKKEIEHRHKEELQPYNEALIKLEVLLLDALNQTKGESLKTLRGTAYKSIKTSVTVNRWSETLAFIQEHELWELLEARVSKTAALAIMDEQKLTIPGVAISQIVEVNVRRPTAKE